MYVDDYLWKFVEKYRTTFSNVKYQGLCATINPSKIEDLQNSKLIVVKYAKLSMALHPFVYYVFRFKQSFINFLYKKSILNVQ